MEHAVIVKFNCELDSLAPLFVLEEQLSAAIDKAGVGEFDGNDVAPDLSEGSLYMYGPDANALFDVVQPILVSAPFLQGAVVLLRYGPPADGVPERQLTLSF